MSHNNLILLTDSYKVSHYTQYPANTTKVYSFFESRGGEFPTTTFFGLQYILKKYLADPIIYRDLAEAEAVFGKHFMAPVFNMEGWKRLWWKHKGYLPLEIKAVPEGTTVPTGNVLMTVVNTDEEFPWLTNWLETLLSQVWYPTTVCTQSRAMKQSILEALKKTGDPAGINFKLHDFGFRGSTSVESSGIGGAAHLVNFMGTDTMSAIMTAREFYGEDMAGFSIPATEHSTITSWGRDHELDAYRNLLDHFPNGLIACVSDSYDIFNACANLWGSELRDKILKRDGTLVIRPDSGDPAFVVLEVMTILGNKFGYHMNDKGFKVLNPHVRVIQGDGINKTSLREVLDTLTKNEWSADNIAFGSGGGLLQNVTRDTQKFAFKCSAIEVNDKWQDVYKEPITDPGKNSKRGRLTLARTAEGVYGTIPYNEELDQLRTVYLNGKLTAEQTLADIRIRSLEGL